MAPRRPAAWAAAVVLGLAASMPAFAQVPHKCTRDGSVFYSDKPCDTDARPAAVATLEPSPLPLALARDARAYRRFMKPVCRTLAEDIERAQQQPAANAHDRQALRARLRSDVERYRENCADDEQQAREQARRPAQAERERQRAERDEQRAQQQRLQVELAQCGEMRRIRDERRAQFVALNAGEKADFERFESNFTQRCQNVTPR